MSLVEKLIGAGRSKGSTKNAGTAANGSITDGALDTLGCVIRTMGDVSFPIADEVDPDKFRELSSDFACHIENGAAVPGLDIPQSADGRRNWAQIRRFFIDRRTDEQSFVTKRLGDYRGVVQKLVDGLRQIAQRDQDTEQAVRDSLTLVEDAVDTGILPDVKIALRQTVQNIEDTFSRQKQEYEAHISELNERMANLRQDLVAVREEMKRDPLTDTFNRGAFDAAIVTSINMHFVLHQPVTLLMIDLDNFKQINDSCGHSAGDEVLKMVGECLARSFIRKSDFVARYGGDEFAVILTDTSAKNATPLVERFLAQVEALKVPYAGADAKVRCSVGYTEVYDDDTPRELVRRADAALYEAKAAGGQRFACAPTPSLEQAEG